MRCTTREAARERYGDIVNGKWPEQEHWLQTLFIPSFLFPNWTVLNTPHIVKGIYCNIDMGAPLLNALTEIHKNGGGELLHTYDGCFNIRNVRGSSNLSCHAYGLAIDINAQEEPLGSLKRLPDVVVKAFTNQGFKYGGDFHGRKDPQHFSFAWE